MIYPKNYPNQTCGYCLITANQQTLRIEANIFYQRKNTKSASGGLQNNSIKGAAWITINCVISFVTVPL